MKAPDRIPGVSLVTDYPVSTDRDVPVTRRRFLPEEYAVRRRVWSANHRGSRLTLTEHEVRALHSASLKTERELRALRAYADFREAIR